MNGSESIFSTIARLFDQFFPNSVQIPELLILRDPIWSRDLHPRVPLLQLHQRLKAA
jgi:hypothetical protein